MTLQGKHLRKGTYAHYRMTDIEGVTLDPSSNRPTPIIASTVQNGFEDRTSSSLSFDDATRTLTITPTGDAFYFWAGGQKWKVGSAESIQISDTEGLHYIYYEALSDPVRVDLKETTTFDLELFIKNSGYVAAVYWDSTNQEAIILNDERHLRMDWEAHAYLHQIFGTQWLEGLSLGNMTVDGNGNSDSHAQFSVSSGSVRDEDILNEISDGNPQELSPIAQIPMFYRTGATGDWRRSAATNFPVVTTGTGRAAWNEFTGATWQLTEVGNNDFVLTHYFATNDTRHPIIGMVGQGSYGNKKEAEGAALVEISDLLLDSIDVLDPELCPIATVIWNTSDGNSNTVQSAIVSTEDGGDYVDWRASNTSRTGVSSVTVVHNDTTNRDAADAHPISAITNLQTSLDGKLGITEKAADSDTVDGLEASQFLRSDVSDTMNGTLSIEYIAASNGETISINAGESVAYSQGNVSGEIVWLVGEGGVRAVSSPDNWSSGWAGRNEATLINTAGNAFFPAEVFINSRAVVDYGSNSNGAYIRFYDGTQICWRGMSAGTWTFPASFSTSSNLRVFGTPYIAGCSLSIIANASVIGLNSANLQTCDATTGNTRTGHTTHWMAIGRWY